MPKNFNFGVYAKIVKFHTILKKLLNFKKIAKFPGIHENYKNFTIYEKLWNAMRFMKYNYNQMLHKLLKMDA